MSNYNADPASGQWHSIVKFTSKTVTVRISAVSAKQPVSMEFHHRERIHINNILPKKLNS